MRTFIFILFLCLPVMNSSSGQHAPEMQLAGAVEASVTRPQEIRIDDNYGDPARFIKYYIKRPPSLA